MAPGTLPTSKGMPVQSAAVLAHTYSQQSEADVMLPTRPTPATGMLSTRRGQNGQQYVRGQPLAPRYRAGTPTGYRDDLAPVQLSASAGTLTLKHRKSWQSESLVRVHDPDANYDGRRPGSFVGGLAYNNDMGTVQKDPRHVTSPRTEPAFLAVPARQSFSPTSQSEATHDRYRRAASPQPSQHSHFRDTVLPNKRMPTARQGYYTALSQHSAAPTRSNNPYNTVGPMTNRKLPPQPPVNDRSPPERQSTYGADSPKSPHDKAGSSQTLTVISNPAAHSHLNTSQGNTPSRSGLSYPSQVTYNPVASPNGAEFANTTPEAVGAGRSTHDGGYFGDSADACSISSTASSASIMLRKMSHGMKKSSRSLARIFQPKSVVGVAFADWPAPKADQAATPMITVEEETQRVNITVRLKATDDFPYPESSPIDMNLGDKVSRRLGSSGIGSKPHRGIVGGGRERTKFLVAVCERMLKRSPRPSTCPVDASLELDHTSVPAILINPSPPSPPNDESQGHRTIVSAVISSKNYSMAALKLHQNTPHKSVKRNATFLPRIVFYDTWPSEEYDRRSEVVTWNLMTPMLAKQIKEEMNAFKMEMEVHENSRIYTHFFRE
ncbi:hypothetical protein NCS57_00799900 [Fusarium keratoplasticum]|uniref:Uncharacterized protein n=1 Tax=Fusarium keratoplasticum TaxID=1328300 RepID=A0ACC0QRL2_9HYPO|nr:hypothetical protein NCS57_00799900 [Fusarium keratoplasticum]KAI8665774.1 hypothetical protein NCS57_00799900 [Fusarium keratoplasticum]